MLFLNQGVADIPELDITRPVPNVPLSSKPRLVERGDGKVNGKDVPQLGLEPGGSSSAPEPERPGTQ